MYICWLQVSVLPLEVYNDVELLAAPALSAQYMVAEAEADAEMCLRKLITNLAAEVWSRPYDNTPEPPPQTFPLLSPAQPPGPHPLFSHTPLPPWTAILGPLANLAWHPSCSLCPLAHPCCPSLCDGRCLTTSQSFAIMMVALSPATVCVIEGNGCHLVTFSSAAGLHAL